MYHITGWKCISFSNRCAPFPLSTEFHISLHQLCHYQLAALAQMVACLPLVQQVRGSIPGGVVNFHFKNFNLGARWGGDVHFLIHGCANHDTEEKRFKTPIHCCDVTKPPYLFSGELCTSPLYCKLLFVCTVCCRRTGQCFSVLRTRKSDAVEGSSGRSYVT